MEEVDLETEKNAGKGVEKLRMKKWRQRVRETYEKVRERESRGAGSGEEGSVRRENDAGNGKVVREAK